MTNIYENHSLQDLSQLREEIAEHIAEENSSSDDIAIPNESEEDEHLTSEEEPHYNLPKNRFYDRELSWLLFNKRVLELEMDPEIPLLERSSFASIFASNLDEFFMVRVAGLKKDISDGTATPSPSGLTPSQQLHAVMAMTHKLQDEHADYSLHTLLPELAQENIVLLKWDDLNDTERDQLDSLFIKEVLPVLTPLAVDPAHPFPYISGGSLNLAILVKNPISGKSHFARVKVPDNMPRLVPIKRDSDIDLDDDILPCHAFITLEDLITAHLDSLFSGMIIQESRCFRITRNEDIEVEEDEDMKNLLSALENELRLRRFGLPIRLEIEEGTSSYLINLLSSALHVTHDEVYLLPTPLDLTMLGDLHSMVDRPDLKNKPYTSVTEPHIATTFEMGESIFDAIRRNDILLHHPYDSFDTSVQDLIAEAAADPKVLAIKQTLYRTAGDSPIITSLVEAANAGKQVLVLVEIKARFDEEANIAWARKLERAGCHVVYGIVGLKTHSKLLLVVRQEEDGLRRYCHIGTGNYNHKTAHQYTDLGLLTCDPDVGNDLTNLFNQLSGFSPHAKFKRLLVAPRGIRKGLIKRIRREEIAARHGKTAWIKIKCNSLVDEKCINALYKASQAGVQIDCVVRGICALKPGIPGVSDNIRVHSILGRFLEHSRIYAFANSNGPRIGFGPEHGPEVWIGSADMMHRNLDHRVEALVRITDDTAINRLLNYLDLQMSDEVMSWHEQPDGTYIRYVESDEGVRLTDCQKELMRRHTKLAKGK
ncbi:MAG: RNA degradosome polyphosphate kinase [Aeriscardovia sp.]|nr:RNA degradosome polyphosphate kinase [Aeriscardovia sp.]